MRMAPEREKWPASPPESAGNHDGVIPTTIKPPAAERANSTPPRLPPSLSLSPFEMVLARRGTCGTRNREYNVRSG